MSLRLLIVDDSPVMRLAIQRTIQISGLPVESCMTAEHGNAALSAVRDNQIDFMLIDLNMPEMSGGELIRRIKQRPERPQIPFIVISADATATRMQEMFDLGALAYIPKPFSPGTLRYEMIKALERVNARN